MILPLALFATGLFFILVGLETSRRAAVLGGIVLEIAAIVLAGLT